MPKGVSRGRTPPPRGDTELGEEYRRSPDPYIALAGAAAVTSRIRLGTGVGLPAQHDTLASCEAIGVTEAVLRPPGAERDEVLPVLDDFSQYLQ